MFLFLFAPFLSVFIVDFEQVHVSWVEQCQWRHSSFFIVNCKHIYNFFTIVKFEQPNVCWVHIEKTYEKTNTFEDKIGYIMRYVVVFLAECGRV